MWRSWQVWASMKITTVLYHQLVKLLHNKEQQDLHQHPIPMVGAELNISDPTHNRGKINRINSFTATQEQMDTVMKQSKGGPVKSLDNRSHSQPGTSTHGETSRPQVRCTACRRTDTSGKTVMKMSSALDAEPDPTLQKCAMSQQKHHCIYCGSVEHISDRCRNKPNDNREEPRSTPRDLREWKPNNTYNRMSQHQARFDEGLNKRYLPNYVNYYQSPLGSIPGQDLSTTLMELANNQSRSLEMMAAS